VQHSLTAAQHSSATLTKQPTTVARQPLGAHPSPCSVVRHAFDLDQHYPCAQPFN
jgi:hypothetical protein